MLENRKKPLKMTGMLVIIIVVVSWVYTTIKLINLYTLNMCNLRYVNYTSGELLKNTKYKKIIAWGKVSMFPIQNDIVI